jgi:hypothetical protein
VDYGAVEAQVMAALATEAKKTKAPKLVVATLKTADGKTRKIKIKRLENPLRERVLGEMRLFWLTEADDPKHPKKVTYVETRKAESLHAPRPEDHPAGGARPAD